MGNLVNKFFVCFSACLFFSTVAIAADASLLKLMAPPAEIKTPFGMPKIEMPPITTRDALTQTISDFDALCLDGADAAIIKNKGEKLDYNYKFYTQALTNTDTHWSMYKNSPHRNYGMGINYTFKNYEVDSAGNNQGLTKYKEGACSVTHNMGHHYDASGKIGIANAPIHFLIALSDIPAMYATEFSGDNKRKILASALDDFKAICAESRNETAARKTLADKGYVPDQERNATSRQNMLRHDSNWQGTINHFVKNETMNMPFRNEQNTKLIYRVELEKSEPRFFMEAPQIRCELRVDQPAGSIVLDEHQDGNNKNVTISAFTETALFILQMGL